jgi:hypothetical protein
MSAIGGSRMVPASVGGGGGAGTVTSVSVVPGNGLNGSVATATTTPAITLSTTVTGVLKGDGTTISAAVAGTDYLSPTTGVPIGDTAEVGTDLAYTDPISHNPIKVLTMSEDTSAVAIAATGDTFPQIVFRPGIDPSSTTGQAIAFGDGSFDPVTSNSALQIINDGNNPANGMPVWTLLGSKVSLELNGNVGNINEQVVADQLSIGSFNGASGNPITIQVGAGNPNTLHVPGNLRDVFFNTTSVGVVDWQWQCTTAGAAGVAVWTQMLALYAPLASPALTGTPTAPTQAALTNNTDIATTAYTDAAVAASGAPQAAAAALAASTAFNLFVSTQSS